jgi:hypothetical protein
LVFVSATVSAPNAFSRTRGLSGNCGKRSRSTLRRDAFSQSINSGSSSHRIWALLSENKIRSQSIGASGCGIGAHRSLRVSSSPYAASTWAMNAELNTC